MTATLEHRPHAAVPRGGPRESELADRLYRPMPADRGTSWLVTIGITVFGGILRFWDLASPHAVVFDETYYMKDSFSLLRWGYEREFVDKANDVILASDGHDWRTLDVFKTTPEFVVHPPVGKWTIGIGEYVFGLNPFGWRFMVALLGTLAILLTIRITRRLTRSTLIGAIAGLLLAIDGIGIVLSRTGLLDNSLMFWAVVAFGCVLMDRDRTRRRLADVVRLYPDDRAALRRLGAGIGPFTGLRPWRWAAGVALGLACGVKWSGVWFLLAFGLMTVFWDIGMRRVIGVRTAQAWTGAILEGLLGAVAMAGTAFVVYLVTWTGWFVTDGGYDRLWAASHPAEPGFGWVPDAFRSLWHYHAEMLNFHVHLTVETSPHAYQSNAWSWMLQTRPTSFYYETRDLGQDGCTVAKCSTEVLALGNPLVWWGGTAALVHQAWRWVSVRDWRAGAVVLAVLAGWIPWLAFQNRTIFTFYVVAFVPFVCMTLALTLGALLGKADASPRRRTVGAAVVGTFLLFAVALSGFFYPVWSAGVIPYHSWSIRMWFPTWV
ncbi:MAG: phospholipid carrier-dependent glycosyltransferase [Frankiales bacterium]|nr:phospholipid carrier-dependent glycosyltransferase [Frankiales bacterium]